MGVPRGFRGFWGHRKSVQVVPKRFMGVPGVLRAFQKYFKGVPEVFEGIPKSFRGNIEVQIHVNKKQKKMF